MFLRKTRIGECLLVAAVASLFLSHTARADGAKDVLKLVPSDAWGFVFAKSLDNIDKKAAQLEKVLQLGIPPQVTPMALGMLNLGETIDTTRPVCAVVMDVRDFGDANNAVVILIPAKDPKALFEKLAPDDAEDAEEGAEEALEDGIKKCMLMGEPAYAAVKGKTVIFGPSQECVTRVFKTKKPLADDVAPARLKAIEDSDLYISISTGDIVGAYKDMFLPMMQMMAGPSGPEAIRQIEMGVKMFEEMASLDIGIRFDESGLSLAFLVSPAKGSDLEKLVGDTKNTADALLSALPKERYLLAFGGTTMYSEHQSKFSGDSPISTFLKAQQIQGLDDDALKTLDTEYKDLIKSVRRWAICIAALPAGSDGMFGVAKVVETRDAEAFIEGFRKLYKAVLSLSDDEDFETVKTCLVHTADAETINGAKVDTLKVDLPKLAEAFEFEGEWVETLTKFVGKDILFRIGAADKTHVVSSFGGGPKRYEAICGALKAGGGALSTDAGIVSLSKQLPSPRSGEMYLAVDNIAQAVAAGFKAMGEEEEFPFKVPTIGAPIAFSTALQGTISRMDMIVPMKLITTGKELFTQFAASAAKDDFDEDEDEDEDDDAESDEEDEDDGDEDDEEDE